MKSDGAGFRFGTAVAALALCAGCAGTAPKTQGDAILPEIDLVQVKENSEEALKLAQEAKRDAEAINSRLAEINNGTGSSSGGGPGIPSAKIEELENRMALLAEALKDLQAQVVALQNAPAPSRPHLEQDKLRRGRGTQEGTAPSSPLSASPAGGSENEAYQNALREFNSRNYEQAQKLFSDIIRQYPAGAYTDNCWYWSGECSYALLDWSKAASMFQKVFEFANSPKADDAQLKIGMCYMKMGQGAQAKAEFKKLIDRYPGSEYVPRAQKFMAEIK